MMNALRLTDGFALALFDERTGLPLTAVPRALDEAEPRGLITRDHLRIAPTELGRRFLNDLLQIFLPARMAGFRRVPLAARGAGSRCSVACAHSMLTSYSNPGPGPSI